MKRFIYLSIVIFVFSCNTNKYIEVKNISKNPYDGIYKTIETGKKYYLLKDSTTSYFTDSLPDICFDDVIAYKKEKDKYGSESFILFINLNESATEKLKKLTTENIGKPLLIIVNDKLLMAPIVQTTIEGGKIQISGNFDEQSIDEIIENFK